MKKNVLLMGMGEVGTAIALIEADHNNRVYVDDPKYYLTYKDNMNVKCDVLHVCIPYSRNFVYDVSGVIMGCKPKVTIIHSTIPVGTTDKIYKDTGANIVHSYIRGIHPHLKKGILTFEKPIGGLPKAVKLADAHLTSLNIKTKIFNSSKETELAKLLDTTYYGWNILYAKQAKRLCDKYGCAYNNVYTWSNISYNEGYTKLGKGDVVRPILWPPEGRIGGHCIGNNFKLLPFSLLKYISIFLDRFRK